MKLLFRIAKSLQNAFYRKKYLRMNLKLSKSTLNIVLFLVYC